MREPPPGLDSVTARDAMLLIKFGLKPWEARMLPRKLLHWLQPIAMCVSKIENGG